MRQVPKVTNGGWAAFRRSYTAVIGCVAGSLLLATIAPNTLRAQQDDARDALLKRVDQLEQALQQVKAELGAMQGSSPAQPSPAPPSSPAPPVNFGKLATGAGSNRSLTNGGESASEMKHHFMEKKPGSDLTFYTPNGEITAYGNLDVSFDVSTKGTAGLIGPDGNGPIGNMGWLPEISTNIAYVGLRGFQKFGDGPLNFVYQMETGIDIASSSGISESNSSESNVVKGGLTSRNSYLGLSLPRYGTAVFGKTDAPYKQTTMRMNPFYGMIGDYQVIMGNTGGDNRVEFGTRLDHSIWFVSSQNSPLRYDILFSPGQNRSTDSDNIAAGESDCTGGDIPGSGGSLPFACNDGSFSNAVSADLNFVKPRLYLTAAYERHFKVNRSSDLTGMYANVPAGFMAADTADEDAAKAGIQFKFSPRTAVSAIYENMHRYLPAYLEFQNERQRQGSWFAFSQEINARDSVSVGWARAYRTPGDPGQHNTSTALPPDGQPGDGVGGPGVDNTSNLFTAAYFHRLAKGLTTYITWAGTFNGPYAHYDLGAGGRSVTTDCHDASDATGDESSNPHCWAAGHLQGISAGLNRKF